MDIFETIETRRSVARLLPREIDRPTIEKVLSAGLWAPNHHLTQPWHFYIFRGEARQKLADAIMENFHRDRPGAPSKEVEIAAHKNPHRVMQTPLCVVVTCAEGKNGTETHENYGACCCAVQNILLAAHAVGLAAYWRTGGTVYTVPNAINELVNAPQNERIVALLLMGYPDPEAPRKPGKRKPLAEKLTWIK